MGYPRLEIDLKKIRHNARELFTQCSKAGIHIAAVTKVFCGEAKIAQVLVEEGITMLADSRMQNIKKLSNLSVPKMLLRIPMLSELEDLVEYVDVSFQSEIDTIRKVSEIAQKQNKIHDIMLMVDLGDLREGCWEDEVQTIVEAAMALKGVRLIGIGANFGCYGGVIPERHTLEKLVGIKEEIENRWGLELEFISGGNSNSLHLLWENQIPKGINQLRLGEPIVLGKEDVYNVPIDGLYQDAFRLFGQVVEIKEKPSVPIGKRGIDAFGNVPVFTDRGLRKRAIVAMGRQDILLDGIQPIEKEMIILGASSDHLLVDIADAKITKKIGDILEFTMSYGALLAAMTSAYVHKVFIE
ncbi:ornithine racemase Orr [Geosporobacter ferrireducens]|uniref:Alanine racemase n=1 Tax=Geosporobacter ferrireducens TaxID=1424294 RepID=A0A1D8GHT5_9FIRM|nr:ornithine racemase Orr [Geosporobacter ferrireducens]AOT70485.1 alanine racemase [Geosporobacter ferrireducens]MTI57167.1 alanine/ornithine racemase family PLP-dependent enzyme [Geosporobacter ferrireducens]